MRIEQIILTFDANAKLLNFTEKLKTARDKCRINMVTWSFLPFAINAILKATEITLCCSRKYPYFPQVINFFLRSHIPLEFPISFVGGRGEGMNNFWDYKLFEVER